MGGFVFTPILEDQTNRPEKAGFSFTPITEAEENDFSAAKPHQIFSVDGSNTNAPARLGVAAKSFHKNKKLHATAVFGESISQSVVRGLLDTAGGVGSFINWYGDNMILPDDFFGLDKKTIDRLNTFGRGWQKAGSILRKGADFVLKGDALKLDEETFSGDFVDNPSFTRTAAAFASAAPSLMSMAGLFKLTGSAGLAYFVMGGVDSADVYEAAKEKGVDLGKTNFLYGTSMAGTALIDRFLSPVENILGKKLIGKSLGKKIADRLVGGMLEATGEGAQTLVQNAVEKYGIDDTKNLFEGVIESMIGGFGSGAFATGAFDRANKNLLNKGATQEEINALVDAAGMYAQKNPDAINDIAFQQLNQGLSNFEKFISEHEGTPEAVAALRKKADLETVGQRIFDRLIDAGQPENVAKAQSRVVQGIALWGAEETGLSPLEYFDQRFPSVQKEKFKEFQERIAKAKDGNVDLFELLVNPREYRRLEQAERGKKGASLLSFLRKKGGLKDDGGELKAMDAGKSYVGLVNNKTGRTLDDMAIEAWEAGYFPEFNERPAVDDLIEAIRDELSGNKRYAFQSENDRSLVAAVDSIAEQMDQLGIDYSKMSAREAENAYNEAVAAYNEKTAAPVAEDAFFTEDETAGVPMETFDDIPFQMDENGLYENDVAKSVIKFNEDLPSVIQSAKEAKGKGTTENKEARFLISQHISQVLKKYGINTFGFTADLNTSFVNHAIIGHGNPSVEEKQGQIAVDYDDFSKIPNVINNPDYIVIEKYKDGSIGLVFVKNMEKNTPFVVELPSRKKKRLLAKTMYKKRRAIHASELRSLNLTSKNVPVDKVIIDVNTENVNTPFYQSSAPRGEYNEKTTENKDAFFTEDETAGVPMETFDDIPFQMDENAESAKTREEGPKIASDDETVEAVKIDENAVPEFKTKKELVEFVKDILENERNITVKSTGEMVLVSNAGINRAAAKTRSSEHRNAFKPIRSLLENAKYSGFVEADERHPNVKGQDVYHSALFIGEKPYAVQFKVDIPKAEGTHNYAGHKIAEIKIAPSENADGRFNSPMQTDDAIYITMGVLRGKVNPARFEPHNKIYYQGQPFAPRGAYYDNVIRLFERANASTFMHETAHWFKAELQSFNSEKSRALSDKVNKWESEEYARRYKTELKDGRYIVRDTLGNIVYDQNFQTEEKAKDYAKNELFARGFEAYLKEGKSPNNYMKQAFKSFWNWLRHLYRSAKSLNVELNDDIRSVYSDIIGGEDIDFYLNAPASEVIGARQKMQKEKETELDGMIERAVEDSKNRSAFDSFFAEKTASNKDRAKWWAKAIVPISTRANRISPRLKNRMRSYEYTLNQKLNEKMTQIKPFLDKWATFSNDDIVAFDLSVKNGYEARRDTILEKYNAIEEFKAVKVLLESIYNEASSVKVEMGYKEDYFPRQVEDVDGLMTYLHGLDMASELRRAEHDAGFEDMTPEEQAVFLNKFLRGFNRKDTTAALPGNVKKRTIIEITPEINVYYKPSIQALTNYIERMNASIESRKFWGFDMDNIDDSIGAFVDELIQNEEIRPDQDKEVEEILRARFKAKGVSNKYLLWQKNASYVYTMGGINSAITQIDDISVALYKAGFWNTVNSIFRDNRPGLSREELGLQKIGQEFMEASTMSKAVDKVFKITGLDAIDGFGKNVLINATFDKFQNMAENDEVKLRERIEPVLENETDETIEDIKAGNISENVKLLMFNELADMQPIALSEMPEYYLTSGNGRILYMLKTFMLKRIDIFRNECFDKIKDGNTKEGVQNLFRLAALMIFCGTAKDAVIDMLFGRKFHLDDMIVNNVLGLFGLTKYQLYKARDEGFEGFASSFIPPLFAMWADLGRDVSKKLFSKNGKDLKDFEIWKGVPVAGRFYYWWRGGGRAKEDKKNKKARLK